MAKIKLEYKKDCCSFCDPETSGNFTWLGDDEIGGYKLKDYGLNEEGFYLEGGCLYAIAGDPYCGTGALKINYCPVCGRSLKVVYKLNEVEKDFEKETENAEEENR